MTIGELAREVGVSVKTIRHYEKLNLLHPLRRNTNGYRVYGPESVRQLKTVRLFAGLGFSLNEIARGLTRPSDFLASLMQSHGRRLDEQIEKLQELRREVSRWELRLQQRPLKEGEFKKLLEVHTTMKHHFSDQALEQMKRRHDQAGESRRHQAREELDKLLVEGDGVGLKALMTEFMGKDGANKAFSSRPALKAVLSEHGLELADATVEALLSS